MLKKNLDRSDGPLTWYLDGSGKRQVVLVGPPGTSVRHWAPLIAQLRPDCRMLAFDYRGFPAGDALLTAEQGRFECCVQDLEAVLAAEGIEQADFVSWCAGTWMVRALQERNPELVRSLVAIGVGRGNEHSLSEFEATLGEIETMLAEDPGSIKRILLRMKRLGLIRDEAYYQAIYDAGDAGGSSSQPLLAMLGGDLAESGLGFSLFDTPTRFLNYLLLFRSFHDNFCRIDELGCPLTLIEGKHSPVAGREPERLAEAVWLLSIEQRTEFIMLEHPRAIVQEIRTHWDQRCAARHAPAALRARGPGRDEVSDGAR